MDQIDETQNAPSPADIESAKKLLAESEKQELDAIGVEVSDFFSALNQRGYGVLPAGNFIGNTMRSAWQIVRVQNPVKPQNV